MFLIREVFKAKPGKAKELVKKFKAAAPFFEKMGEGKNHMVMTDVVADYWTVVMQWETDDLGKFATNLRGGTASPELMEIMKGYIDLVEGGHREIFLVE
jgi:hypothetical protein